MSGRDHNINSQRERYNRMFDEHYEMMYRYGMRLLQDKVSVEDGIQNVFMRLWLKKDQLSIQSESAYLLISLRRELLLNKKNTIDMTPIDEGFNITFNQNDMLEQEMVGLQRNRITLLLNQLSQRQKEIIYLHFYEDRSYQEIASILEVKYQSVLNNLQRAFSKLREKEKFNQ
ncbi:RNA polymerase sigma factor [Membranihabitans marinus]|uniref:RNA polymerase sigma factor n=1 Tax=Membranihabitans marinus TaxID=1227546 RepID=UPI001F276EE1|nr:sigma-70 family RNA polymerase sigma factor [Membranihabitans marinus]